MTTWVPSIIALAVLLVTLAFGYGKLSQKIDSLSKDIDNVRKDIDNICKDVAELRQFHVSHLENH